ncbi:MAG: hypothetical protein GTO37_00375, partial [Planctomycetales bacterium]|nr:hypothetical protein [Planctomycetales bacterium]
MDVTEALLTILVAALAYLLFVSVLDHWLFSGGLPTWVRYLAWIGLLVSSLAYAVRTVLPHLLYRVSWLYAADAVERAEPSLKNSLLNFLMLRGDHRGVPQIIYQNLEQRAAADISQVPAELAVDRSRILKIGYLLIAVALACAVYKVLSPKDLLPSVGRVLAPWSDIPPQTRVKILNVQPGHAEALLLSQVPVQAEIRGLDDHETAQLVYSTTDQQAVDVAVPMYIRDGQRYHSCSLPEDPSGLSQDVEYRIEAGDCRSQTYRIRVVIAPTIHVKKVEYAYPPYTGLDPRTVEGVGDIKAIEGTLVVIHAEASHQIASGYVQLEGIRSQTIPLKFTGKTARCQLPLQRKLVGSESLPLWTNYRLNITTPQGAENENPIRHRIQIIPDLPPLVEIMKPGQASVSVPADGHLDVEVRARDQDYQLSDVRLVGEYQQGTLLDEPLANEQRPFAEPVRTSFRFEPQKYDLQPGDVVRYAAVAADNKTPTANQAVTADYEIIITEPENRSAEFPPADRPQDERQDERQDQPPGGAQGDDGQ